MRRGSVAVVDPRAQPLEHVRWHQAADVAAEAEDFLHHARADKRVAARPAAERRSRSPGRDGDSSAPSGTRARSRRWRECRAAPPKRPGRRAKSTIRPSNVATETLPIRPVASFEHLHALFHGEERILDRIHEDRHGEMVEELRSALDQVHVTVGGRVEGAGIEGFHGHGAR